MPTPKKKWTVMVWMAGDNDLEEFGTSDIAELKKTGTTDDVTVLVQFDSMSDDHTRRYHVRHGTSVDADAVADLGETNTGDPSVATDFFSWGMAEYPADHTLAVLWNHGSGIDETDVYRRARSLGLEVTRHGSRTRRSIPRSLARTVVSKSYRRALFSTTVEAALTRRGIGYDDSARDFLDNMELKNVLARVKAKAKRAVDVVGFDACLMSMAEVAYQLRNTARLVVGSEETEPGDGWPYDRVLADLAARPTMTPAELGAVIVKRYVASYSSDDVTLALLDLGRSTPLARAVSELGGQLAAAIATPAEYAAVAKSINAAQHYYKKDFLDLYDLCDQLTARVKSAKVKAAAEATRQVLRGDQPFVAAEAHKGSTVARSHGAAIYFPRGDVSVAYDRLDFAKNTKWDAFIAAYQAG